MKMTQKDYNTLKTEIKKYINDKNIIMKDRDNTERLRWDLLWFMVDDKRYSIQPLYSYLNDNHIDTALKNIVNTLI